VEQSIGRAAKMVYIHFGQYATSGNYYIAQNQKHTNTFGDSYPRKKTGYSLYQIKINI
jgi:hypothetical protein